MNFITILNILLAVTIVSGYALRYRRRHSADPNKGRLSVAIVVTALFYTEVLLAGIDKLTYASVARNFVILLLVSAFLELGFQYLITERHNKLT